MGPSGVVEALDVLEDRQLEFLKGALNGTKGKRDGQRPAFLLPRTAAAFRAYHAVKDFHQNLARVSARSMFVFTQASEDAVSLAAGTAAAKYGGKSSMLGGFSQIIGARQRMEDFLWLPRIIISLSRAP